MPRNYYRKDPRWIIVRYASRCARCDVPLGRGARAYYWPTTRELECNACGATSSQRFEAEAADEYMMGGGY